MPFVGIIAENRDFDTIKKMLEEENLNIELMQIKQKNIENIKNIKFETILINKKIKDDRDYLLKILENAKYLIVNSDIEFKQDMYKKIELQIISYGFNNKATITASSVTDNNVMVCIQRNINVSAKKEIEQQEFNINKQQKKFQKPYNAMAYFAINSIYK